MTLINDTPAAAALQRILDLARSQVLSQAMQTLLGMGRDAGGDLDLRAAPQPLQLLIPMDPDDPDFCDLFRPEMIRFERNEIIVAGPMLSQDSDLYDPAPGEHIDLPLQNFRTEDLIGLVRLAEHAP